jgi:hypothetical protein
LGNCLLVYGRYGSKEIVASLDPHQPVAIGSTVYLQVNLKTLHVFHPETQTTLL